MLHVYTTIEFENIISLIFQFKLYRTKMSLSGTTGQQNINIVTMISIYLKIFSCSCVKLINAYDMIKTG